MHARTYNQNHVPRSPHRQAAHQHLLDLELSLGSPTRSGRHGEPLLHHDRGAQRRCGRPTRRPNTTRRNFLQGIAGTLELFHRSTLGFQETRRGGHRTPGRRLPAHRPGRLQAADRRTDPGRHRHADGVRPRPPAVRTGGRAGGDRGDHASGSSAKAPACCSRRTTTSASPTTSSSGRSNTSTTATGSCRASSASASTPAR